MGYLSDVGLCLNGHAYDLLNKAIGKVEDEKIRFAIHELLAEASVNRHPDGAIAFKWEYYRWYEEPEIFFIREFLESLSPKEYLFLRSGEDSDDTEADGAYCDNPFKMKAYSCYGIISCCISTEILPPKN